MSLAAHTGGMGAGGMGAMAMAHQPNGMAAARHQAPPKLADSGHGAPPPSASILGADLLDKQQMVSLKQVKNLSHLPIVAIDLFAPEPTVATFPPKPIDPSEAILPSLVGKMRSSIFLKVSDSSHKTLRKYLTGSKPYSAVNTESIGKAGDTDTVHIDAPYRWLGFRRIDDKPAFYDEQKCDDSKPGVAIVGGALDGSDPKGDDFDRVVYKVRLQEGKKAMSLLPEEAVQLLLHQAQFHVASKNKTNLDDEEIVDYPCAVAIPAWASHDASIEALHDATSHTGVFFQRSVCALAGSLLQTPDGSSNPVLERLEKVREALGKDFRRRKAEDPGASFNDDVLLVLLGMTHDGFEATAIQVSHIQPALRTCLFGNFKVLANVSYQDNDPLSRMAQSLKELENAIDLTAPEADGPAGILTYGTKDLQEKMKTKWERVKSEQVEWTNVPLFTTKSDVVTMGTAMLGAVTHGRQSVLVDKGGKTKADLGLRVQNVSPCAVGVRINYHGGDPKQWEPIKVIFDFDRRIPAGPYAVELVASECVVHRNGPKGLSDEDFLKAAKENEAAACIPKREEAALELRVEVLQKWTRDGQWKRVGDTMEPLVKLQGDADDEKRIACERVALEISLGVTGMLTSNMVGDRESVVQATKSARTAKFQFYLGIGLAVLFFGGFLVRSYWEEHVFERDTQKLLNYYRNVVPGSIADGDERNARFIVWKYRNNKQKLWNHLETKYGIPVLELDEWEGFENPNVVHPKKPVVEGEEVDLDGEDATTKESQGDGQTGDKVVDDEPGDEL